LKKKKTAIFGMLMIFLAGCATNAGIKEQPLQYNPKTGTYKKTYTTGELASNFVKDLVGVGD